MFNIFLITDWKGNSFIITDKELRDRIINDSKDSENRLIVPAGELLKTCNKKSFNKEYAKDIKIAVVNYYALILYNGDITSDINYAYQAFNELFNNDDELSKKARYNFLKAFIFRNTIFLSLQYCNYTYCKLENEWKKRKTDELLEESYINFNVLEDRIKKEYEWFITEKVNNTYSYEKSKESSYKKEKKPKK